MDSRPVAGSLHPNTIKAMTSRERHVTGTLVQLADTLVAGYDMAEMFYFLVESCTDVLSIDHAGLMLVDADGTLHVVAATSEVTHLIELLQIQNQEGPCLDAFRSGLVVESGPLTDPEVRARWPRLSEAAHDAGRLSAQPQLAAAGQRARDPDHGRGRLGRRLRQPCPASAGTERPARWRAEGPHADAAGHLPGPRQA